MKLKKSAEPLVYSDCHFIHSYKWTQTFKWTHEIKKWNSQEKQKNNANGYYNFTRNRNRYLYIMNKDSKPTFQKARTR